MSSYEEIMGIGGNDDAAKALSKRLVAFRKWLNDEAKATLHPAVCIVNGEATDGTKNAPVLVFDTKTETNGNEGSKFAGRVGAIDGDSNTSLYDRTMGCQVRSTREIKKEEVILDIPRSAFITPDLIASSDAGKAVFSCCQTNDCANFWDAFENTSVCVSRVSTVGTNVGAQALVKTLHKRFTAEGALKSRLERGAELEPVLAPKGTISTRAPFLAFLIQQRFLDADSVPVAGLFDGELPEEIAVDLAADVPDSFSPYARTLPSYVSVPLCWKRPELALLAACLPGHASLQEVALSTSQLSAEFTSLLDAGILERFPDVFPPGLITWDRWVWAAAVFSSRLLPASTYSEAFASDSRDKILVKSPIEVWRETGVMIPLFDMLNHVAGENHITWKSVEGENPQAITHRKVKKGSEVFTDYGIMSNGTLLLQYGFAQMNNAADEVRLGWALADAVGNVDVPFDFTPPYENKKSDIYESNDEAAINAWWTKDRLELLEKLVFAHPKTAPALSSVKLGKKLTVSAYSDGAYDPMLLLYSVSATMPSKEVQTCLTHGNDSITVSRKHLRILQRYLRFFFTRKLEKLLQNLNSGLKAHFSEASIWTKASDGGLNYESKNDETGDDCVGWYSFFDAHAYRSSMEMEGSFYALGVDACVLTLYDGQLRVLQASVDGVSDEKKWSSGVLTQLEDLGLSYSKEEEPNGNASPDETAPNGVGTPSKSKRKKKEKGSSPADRPPALKLHVGNLSYSTTPSDLFNYFSSVYGQDNVLECHIPIERDSGRSRGFGFVAMPEAVALKALEEGVSHEVGGRILKVAKSNSAGSVSTNRTTDGPPPIASDRCLDCGYRPRYCTCEKPNITSPSQVQASKPVPSSSFSGSAGYEPSPDYGHRDREYDRYGTPNYQREDRRRDYDYDDKDRYYDGRDRRYRYDDDYRRSYDRDDDYYYRDSSRGRGDRDGRSREHSATSHGSGRRWERDDRDRSSSHRDRKVDADAYDRGEKRSRSKEKSRRRKRRKNHERSRSGSRDSDKGAK